MKTNSIYGIDARKGIPRLENNSIQSVITSPPYYHLRDYGISTQLGQENTPEEYVSNIVNIFSSLKPKLKDDATLWLNLSDTYCRKGRIQPPSTTVHKTKDLYGVPWTIALALKADGWYLRQDIIWHKPNPLPESVQDRCTKSHEYLFLFSKQPEYYFDNKAIKQPLKESSIKRLQQDIDQQKGSNRIPGKTNGPIKASGSITEGANRRSVWTIASVSRKTEHLATFPPSLPRLCILAGSREGDLIFDPFAGSGTTLIVAKQLKRNFIGFDIQPLYVRLARNSLAKIKV